MIQPDKKSLIAYYSRKGYNYVSGSIINLTTGNTEVIAKKIKDFIGGDLFKINTVKSDPLDYYAIADIVRFELRQNARPELTGTIKNMYDYDVIFLGYPNWWGTFPMAVCTFLESYDFSGKTIAPFCTHEGSGLGSSEGDIKRLCPNAKILPGIAIRGSLVTNAGSVIQSWLKKQE
jgi:flavodoxin